MTALSPAALKFARSQVRRLNNQDLVRPDYALFCRIKDESYFLPHFLDHYRALGIEHFYFADDKSTDGTRELILSEPDCTVIDSDFLLSDKLKKTKGKDIALRHFPEWMIGDGWTLSVDADEFLILPPEYSTIGELARALDAQGEISCVGAMVDFYPKTLAGRFVDRRMNPLQAFPFFDAGPYFIWEQGQLMPFLLFGGVRHRINEWMFERDGRDVWPVYRPTMLHKVPLIKWGHGMRPVHPHEADLPPNTRTQVALAHFKFYPDLDLKIEEGLKTDYYFGYSYYYRLLERYLPVFADRSLLSLTSRLYRGPEDLVRAHLLFANGRPF